MAVVEQTGTELIVLARYMQILPSFQGAKSLNE
ncbi:formyltetrahydrofolate hydrolase [Rhizobium giardinii]|uniref:Formyltetrahydrofolate hydrolase n=1 Tax=Rhizobium giardinii TaxID=56731 RepID=A0A7W8UH10_9HYPH|nr:formyltetrahydrofolate hydrolase [Rhizobium giardinii]